MVELVDTTDLKSVDLRVVRVQVPLRVPKPCNVELQGFFCVFLKATANALKLLVLLI